MDAGRDQPVDERGERDLVDGRAVGGERGGDGGEDAGELGIASRPRSVPWCLGGQAARRMATGGGLADEGAGEALRGEGQGARRAPRRAAPLRLRASAGTGTESDALHAVPAGHVRVGEVLRGDRSRGSRRGSSGGCRPWASPVRFGGFQSRKYALGARRIAPMRTWLSSSSRPANSIVPASLRLRASGVTATLASERLTELRRSYGSTSML